MWLFQRYEFWLIIASAGCFLAERIKPWRKQDILRPLIAQDVFWLLFNGIFSYRIFKAYYGFVSYLIENGFYFVFGVSAKAVALFAKTPLFLQVILLLLTADFLEWCIHNLLHRNQFLWKIHRIHHSIHIMDWIGNFRFHWGEVLVYQTLKFLPLMLLGVQGKAVLIASVIATTMGHINHSNLNISWGPLRYVLNSPRMHIWHHEKFLRGKAGVNFAVVFSLWDWLFHTAFLPPESQPDELGFAGDQRLPDNLLWRFFLPVFDRKK